MRLAELSERSGVSTTTIKYYLREGLLPPGERVTATQADYSEEHLRRLGLVRALIQVGRVPVATARQVLEAVEDDSLDLDSRLGTAVGALPGVPTLPGAVPDAATGQAESAVAGLVERLGWSTRPDYPGHTMLVAAVSALARLGYPCGVDELLPYGELADRLAVHDLDLMERFDTPVTRLEAAVALTVLYEPVLLSLRRLAHAEQSQRRYHARSDCGPPATADGA
ncbi:MerR family transcriptional regulator [Streptomyces sp. 549]|uniref:MerR family transcriptional regulator n=1 Tax=Streptomyces sp. 549 TaxID=3049076 RepID=UPI0024C29551|nr:MerR family transcriptional regulator [Streptomyces sp. 549]MDK1475056.1 MerR family transcriptional regulator [Streptomyces sp. 549]